MPRLAYGLAMLLSFAAFGWQAYRLLWPDGPGSSTPRVATAGRPVAMTDRSEPATEATWPQMFGEPLPAPVPVGPGTPPPPDYSLRGLVISGAKKMAILNLDGADLVVREGETLGPRVSVERIHSEGVDFLTDGRRITLAFSGRATGDATRREVVPDTVVPVARVSGMQQGTGFRGITDEELRVILEAAGAHAAILPQ